MTRLQRTLLVIAFSVLPHLFGISSPPIDYHHHRQTNTAAIARNYHDNGMRFFHPQIDWAGPARGRAATEFPLYMYLIGLFWGVFGLGAVWGRLISIACSAATAWLLMRFLEGWIDKRAALYAALLFSLIPVEVYFGRTIQPEALALLCTMGAFISFDRYFTARPQDGRTRLGWWILSWACAATAIGHKLPYGYLCGVLAVIAWARQGKRAIRDIGSLALIPAILLAVFSWYKFASLGSYVVPTEKDQFLQILDYSNIVRYVMFQFISRFPELAVGWPGMGFFAAGIWGLTRKGFAADAKRFLLGWLACLGVYSSLGGGYLHSHDYTALPWALITASIMGLGAHFLTLHIQKLKRPYRSRGSIALVLVLLATPIYTYARIGHWYGFHDRGFLRNVKGPVESVSGPDDLFLCNERAESLILFFIGRRGWSSDIKEIQEPPLDWVRRHQGLGARFFMTRTAGVFSDKKHPLAKPIYDNFPEVYRGEDFLIFRLEPYAKRL